MPNDARWVQPTDAGDRESRNEGKFFAVRTSRALLIRCEIQQRNAELHGLAYLSLDELALVDFGRCDAMDCIAIVWLIGATRALV